MPRNISFSMTTPQFIDGSKDVTRRLGWWNSKEGDVLMAVEKAMGLKKGETMIKLGLIELVSARIEPLNAMCVEPYGSEELRREGYPFGCTDPREFVRMLAEKSKVPEDEPVMRLEFIRLKDGAGLPLFEGL